MFCYCFIVFFFFKQKTAYEMRISDWSSDVCSSDLPGPVLPAGLGLARRTRSQVERLRRRPGMVGEARRNREGWRNRRLGLQPVPAADRVLVGQVGPNTAAEVAASATSAQIGRASGRDRECQYE